MKMIPRVTTFTIAGRDYTYTATWNAMEFGPITGCDGRDDSAAILRALELAREWAQGTAD